VQRDCITKLCTVIVFSNTTLCIFALTTWYLRICVVHLHSLEVLHTILIMIIIMFSTNQIAVNFKFTHASLTLIMDFPTHTAKHML